MTYHSRAAGDMPAGIEHVQVPTKHTAPFAREAHTCWLKVNIQAGNPNPEILQLLGADPHVMQVWLSTTNQHKEPVEIVLTEQLVYQKTSFGIACPLCMAKAVLSVLNTSTHMVTRSPIVLKMRKVTRDSEHLTQVEAAKTVRTWETDEIRDLFPYLYLLGKLHTRHGEFECIGSEPMEPSPIHPGIPLNDHNFRYMQEAYALVARLHGLGFAHGDPHSGNFMLVPKDSNHPVFNPLRLTMIDQDTLQELPHPDHHRDLHNALILRDFAQLTYHNNPWMPALGGLHPEQIAWLFNKLCVSHTPHPLFMPACIYYYMSEGLDHLQSHLSAPELHHYHASLRHWTPEDIHAAFHALYFAPGELQRLTAFITQFRQLLGY